MAERSRWTRARMSPSFQVNFMKGTRFMQFSALLPLWRIDPVDAPGIPISFESVDRPPKLGPKATEAQHADDRRLCREPSPGKHA